MRRLAGAAIVGTRAYQRHAVAIGLVLLAIAVLLGMTVADAVTLGMVRPSAQWIRIRSLRFAFLSILRSRHSRRQSLIQPLCLQSISLTGFYVYEALERAISGPIRSSVEPGNCV